jgi:hypothetical protein
MSREITFTVTKTYATKENVRKAVAKKGVQNIRHFIMQTDDGRFFPVFRPTESEMAQTGILFFFHTI